MPEIRPDLGGELVARSMRPAELLMNISTATARKFRQ